TGLIYTTPVSDVYLARLDSSGNIKWRKNIPVGDEDIGFNVVQASDGGFVIASTSDSKYFLIKTNNGGMVQWKKEYLKGLSITPISDHLPACSIDLTADAGFIFSCNKNDSAFLVRTNASGDSLWSKVFAGVGKAGFNIARTMPDKGFAAGGYSSRNAARQYAYFVKTDSTGAVT